MLCMFAQYFPRSVASLLQRGERLRRRFREETVTDLLMSNLMTLGGGSIVVDFPDEPATGADMEWHFINRDTREHFQMLLQAKRVYDTGPNWRTHRYKELFYRSGPLKILQVDTLCNTARLSSSAIYPAYVFYNLSNTCYSANAAGWINFSGVNLCDAYVVQAFAARSNSPKVLRKYSEIVALYPHLFSLTDIFCPSNVQPLGPMAFSPPRFSMPMILSFGEGRPSLGRPYPPRPDQVRQRLVDQRSKIFDLSVGLGISIDLPSIPEVSKEIPSDLLPLIDRFDGGEELVASPVDRWRATFISVSARDEVGRLRE